MNVKELRIKDFIYDLPEAKIAFYPLAQRDASKLLLYKNDEIKESHYAHLADHLPENARLVFNNTKVIHARLLFPKPTGGIIEIFILEAEDLDISSAMQKEQQVVIRCFIGGASKWKPGTVLQKEILVKEHSIMLQASFLEKKEDYFLVKLAWGTSDYFAEIVAAAGNIPLPPYIKRQKETLDESRYQTIYAAAEGSVAAPTAGLHFTQNIFTALAEKKIQTDYVTLHVGAGTFKPVTATIMEEHRMHEEYIVVQVDFIKSLLREDQFIVGVGTTSVRTLESLFWLGCKIRQHPEIAPNDLYLEQWEAYELPVVDKSVALQALLAWMKTRQLTELITTTKLLIAPSYTFRMLNAIITNFHQPGSTLLLLVAAATRGNWRKLYNYALEKEFRFLSYGDGCLIYL